MYIRRLMLVLVILAPAAFGGEPTAEPLRTEFTDDGRLTVVYRTHTLLKQSAPPRLYFFNWEAAENPERPPYQWMVKVLEHDFDAEKCAFTARYNWGSLAVEYTPKADRMDLAVRVTNGTERVIDSMRLWLTEGFEFPKTPKGYRWQKGWHVMAGGLEPAVVVADYGEGAVVACLTEAKTATRFGWGHRKSLTLDLNDIAVNETRKLEASLRFGPGAEAGGDPLSLAQDIFDAFAKQHPRIFHWPDRRPIAALHPSSSHIGAGRAGETTNPRGWIGGAKTDITTPEGRARWKEAMMQWARRSVKICTDMNAQGVIVWSLEGQEMPHAISYIGSPQSLAEVAPEMDEIADEWFKVFSDAGLRTGVCVRPQQLTRHPKWDPDSPPNKPPFRFRQQNLYMEDQRFDEEGTVKLLSEKIAYAQKRWGCTIFYVDSNVTHPVIGGKRRRLIHPYTVYEALARKFPRLLIIPEHERFMFWSCSVPLGVTPLKVQRVWPDAFSVNLMQNVNDAKPETVARYVPLVGRGDILLFAGWYDAAVNRLVRAAYEKAYTPKWHDPDRIPQGR